MPPEADKVAGVRRVKKKANKQVEKKIYSSNMTQAQRDCYNASMAERMRHLRASIKRAREKYNVPIKNIGELTQKQASRVVGRFVGSERAEIAELMGPPPRVFSHRTKTTAAPARTAAVPQPRQSRPPTRKAPTVPNLRHSQQAALSVTTNSIAHPSTHAIVQPSVIGAHQSAARTPSARGNHSTTAALITNPTVLVTAASSASTSTQNASVPTPIIQQQSAGSRAPSPLSLLDDEMPSTGDQVSSLPLTRSPLPAAAVHVSTTKQDGGAPRDAKPPSPHLPTTTSSTHRGGPSSPSLPTPSAIQMCGMLLVMSPGPASQPSFSRRRSPSPASESGAKRSARAYAPSRLPTPQQIEAEDLQWLKDLGLHHFGKEYKMVNEEKGKVEEQMANDFVNEIEDLYKEDGDFRSWVAKAKNSNHSQNDFEYVIGTTKYDGVWDESKKAMSAEVLVKLKEFPMGKWVNYLTLFDRKKYSKNKAIQAWRWREKALSKARVEMRAECAANGEDFDVIYGKVFLDKISSECGEFATDEAAKRRTLLRAREATINSVLERVGLPPIIIEDWTGDASSDKNILEFVWTNYVHLSKKVKKARRKARGNPLKHKCGVNCPCNGGQEAVCDCDEKKGVELTPVECGDSCACSIDCSTRILQRGRQHPQLIILHPKKGWTIRALEDLPEKTFLGEYTGEILTAWDNNKTDQTYCIDHVWPLIDRRKRPNNKIFNDEGKTPEDVEWLKKRAKKGYRHRLFVNNGLNMGNEGKFFAHHCCANVEVLVRWVDRKDWAFQRITFWTKCPIRIGQELCWNYHSSRAKDFHENGKNKFHSSLLPECACGAGEDCMILPWGERAKDGKTMAEREDEPEPEYDSFSEGEEEDEIDGKKKVVAAGLDPKAKMRRRRRPHEDEMEKEEEGEVRANSSKRSSVENRRR